MKNAIKWKLITYGLLPILLLSFVLFLIFQEPAPDYIDPSIIMTSTTSNKEVIYASLKSLNEKKSDGRVNSGFDYSGALDPIFWLSSINEGGCDPGITTGDFSQAIGLFGFDHRYTSAQATTFVYNADPVICEELKPFSAYSDTKNATHNALYMNSAFDTAWQTVGRDHPGEFALLQAQAAIALYFDPSAEEMLKDTGVDVRLRSDAVRAAAFSINMWKPIIMKDLMGNKGLSEKSTDLEVLTALYDRALEYGNAQNSSLYGEGWRNRWGGWERTDALAMLNGTFDYIAKPGLYALIQLVEGVNK